MALVGGKLGQEPQQAPRLCPTRTDKTTGDTDAAVPLGDRRPKHLLSADMSTGQALARYPGSLSRRSGSAAFFPEPCLLESAQKPTKSSRVTPPVELVPPSDCALPQWGCPTTNLLLGMLAYKHLLLAKTCRRLQRCASSRLSQHTPVSAHPHVPAHT